MLMRPFPLIGGRLLESAAIPARRRGSLVLSVVVHAALVSAGAATALGPKLAPPDDVNVAVMQLAFAPPRVASGAATQMAPTHPARPKGFQVLAAPRDVPATIDVAAMPPERMNVADFSGRGVLGGIADGIEPSRLATGPSVGDVIDASIADQPPYLLPDQLGPGYPEQLRDAAPDGLVVVRFIIDTLGRAERASVNVVSATDSLFTASVRTALERLRFAPARLSGQRVRARVEQRYEFHLAGR